MMPIQTDVPRLPIREDGRAFSSEEAVRPAFAIVHSPYSTNMPPNPNQVDASRAFGSTLDSEGPGR
jgi:hypothetical protein